LLLIFYGQEIRRITNPKETKEEEDRWKRYRRSMRFLELLEPAWLDNQLGYFPKDSCKGLKEKILKLDFEKKLKEFKEKKKLEEEQKQKETLEKLKNTQAKSEKILKYRKLDQLTLDTHSSSLEANPFLTTSSATKHISITPGVKTHLPRIKNTNFERKSLHDNEIKKLLPKESGVDQSLFFARKINQIGMRDYTMKLQSISPPSGQNNNNNPFNVPNFLFQVVSNYE